MDKEKKGFWRNFTFKRFFRNSIYWFSLTLLIGMLVNYFDPSDAVSNLFTLKELVSRSISSLLIGLIWTVWMGSIFVKKTN